MSYTGTCANRFYWNCVYCCRNFRPLKRDLIKLLVEATKAGDEKELEYFFVHYTPLNNTQFSIDAYNALIASIYLHQYFCILKILAHSVDFNELYRNVTIHCPSFSLVR